MYLMNNNETECPDLPQKNHPYLCTHVNNRIPPLAHCKLAPGYVCLPERWIKIGVWIDQLLRLLSGSKLPFPGHHDEEASPRVAQTGPLSVAARAVI